MANAMIFGLDRSSVYLWTLPMFHCNGWGFTWAVTAVAGTHVCLRRTDPASIFSAIAEHRVTHLCGAPIVLNLLVHAPEQVKRRFGQVVQIATGGAAPPSAVIEAMEHMGFRVTHLYGLTESYGPSTVCAWQEDWAGLPIAERASLMARQGVRNLMLTGQRVVDPKTMTDVPADGATLGELVLRGNTLMKGYFKNPEATEKAFEGGWFHTGDLAVLHPDSYIEIKDRSKDIIIVGGDNLSSLEVEDVLYRHPQIMEAAVVAKPDPLWGEIPCAFVTLKPDAGAASSEDIIDWCRGELAQYKVPRMVVFGPLPKTSTGKIQKFELRERAKEIAIQPDHAPEAKHLNDGDALERELQDICERVLGISPEWSQNLLECSADSLTVLRLFMVISERYKCDLPLGAFFDSPTISGLASVLRGTKPEIGPRETGSRPHATIAQLDATTAPALLRLMPHVWTKWHAKFVSEIFRWRYLDRPSAGGTWLAFDNDECAAVIDSFIRPYLLESRRVLVREPADWFSLPDYRPFGLGLKLMREMMERPEPIIVIGGTRATQSLLPGLGWKTLPAVQNMVLPVTLRGLAGDILHRRWSRRANYARAIPGFLPVRAPRAASSPICNTRVEEWQPGQELSSVALPQQNGLIALLELADLEWIWAAPRGLFRPVVLVFWVGGEAVGLSLSQLEPTGSGPDGRIVHLRIAPTEQSIADWVASETARRLSQAGAGFIRCRASAPMTINALRNTGFTAIHSEPGFWWAKDRTPPPVNIDVGYLRGDDALPFGVARGPGVV
jgi:hypothetical protein